MLTLEGWLLRTDSPWLYTWKIYRCLIAGVRVKKHFATCRRLSPIDSANPRHQVEVVVSTQERALMLTA